MFFQDDASTCSDESAGEIFKSIPKGRTAFCIWKIEVYRCGLYRVNCPPSWIRVATKTISLGRAKLGTFFTDSAYLIYAVSAKDGPLPYPGMPVSHFLSSLRRTIAKNVQFTVSYSVFFQAKDLKDCQSLRAIHFWGRRRLRSRHERGGSLARRRARLSAGLRQARGAADRRAAEAQAAESTARPCPRRRLRTDAAAGGASRLRRDPRAREALRLARTRPADLALKKKTQKSIKD
ncbi:unnamed protein product, partial [Trichogramma brassicae]